MQTEDITEDCYRDILEAAYETQTKWSKQQKNYIDEKGASQTLISYNDLLHIVKRAMMAGTIFECKRAQFGSEDVPLRYRALKHEKIDGNFAVSISPK